MAKSIKLVPGIALYNDPVFDTNNYYTTNLSHTFRFLLVEFLIQHQNF